MPVKFSIEDQIIARLLSRKLPPKQRKRGKCGGRLMHSLTTELDFWHFDQDLMVFKDGSLGAGFKLAGFDMTCATDQAINQLTRGLENLLVSCDEGMRLQIFYKLSPNVDELIDQHRKVSSGIGGNYKRLADARVEFYRCNQHEGNYFVPNIFFFVQGEVKTSSEAQDSPLNCFRYQ